MRIIVALILCILPISQIIAQPFERVLKSDTVKWNYLSTVFCADCIETIEFLVFGDTVFNDLNYKPLYVKHIGNNLEKIGYLHEDIDSGFLKMLSYNLHCQDTPCIENIIYDMRLKTGDTLVINDYYNSYSCKVSSVDTIDNKKIIYFSDYDFQFIEGVGSSREFSLEGFLNGELSELLCQYYNGELVYSRTVWEFDTCYVFESLGVESSKPISIRLFPNPISSGQSIEIDIGTDYDCSVSIINLNGILLYNEVCKDSSMCIASEDFTSVAGVYIINITDINREWTHSQLIIIN